MKLLSSKFTQYFGFLSSSLISVTAQSVFFGSSMRPWFHCLSSQIFQVFFSFVQANDLTEITYTFITWWFLLQYFYYFDNEIRVDLQPDLLIIFNSKFAYNYPSFFQAKNLVRYGCLYWVGTSDGRGQGSLIEEEHSSGGDVGSLTVIIANIGSRVCIQ